VEKTKNGMDRTSYALPTFKTVLNCSPHLCHSEIYSTFPEKGDADKTELVLFIDEAI
jgi:hypothetical protein